MSTPIVSYNWPADFPLDCPPGAALPADGVFYRIVKNDPPRLGDFLSLYHLNRDLAERRIGRGATRCETMGLSIYAELGDALAAACQFSSIGDWIVPLTLEPVAGKILPTPRYHPAAPENGDSHHTWWKNESYEPLANATTLIRVQRT